MHSPAVTDRAELRRLLRQDCRYTLLTDLGRGKRLPLCLPVASPAALTDEDVYSAGLGSGDRLSRRRDNSGDAARLDYADPTGIAAIRADARRRYLAAELPGHPTMLRLEHATVLAAFDRLEPRDRQMLADLGLTANEVAKRERCAPDSIDRCRQRALDALLDLLLRTAGRRVA